MGGGGGGLKRCIERQQRERMQEGGGISETSDRAYNFSEGMGSATPFWISGPRGILKGNKRDLTSVGVYNSIGQAESARRACSMPENGREMRENVMAGRFVVSVSAGASVFAAPESRDAPPQPP